MNSIASSCGVSRRATVSPPPGPTTVPPPRAAAGAPAPGFGRLLTAPGTYGAGAGWPRNAAILRWKAAKAWLRYASGVSDGGALPFVGLEGGGGGGNSEVSAAASERTSCHTGMLEGM